MGEAKRRSRILSAATGQPLETAAAPVRPNAAIAQMKASCLVTPADADPDTKAFMSDLNAVLEWIDHLESDQTGETPIPN